MLLIILISVCVLLSALYFGRRIYETLPAGIFAMMLLTYVLALTNHLSGSLKAAAFVFAVLSVAFMFLIFKEKEFNVKITVSLLSEFVIYSFFSALLYWVFKDHFVTNWDDLNYWAMFPRDLYEKGGMVSGASECTVFKDYTPIMQLFYYTLFRINGGFSEGIMFFANNFLLYICLLPAFAAVFGNKSLKKSSKIFFGCFVLLFPLFTCFQQLHCLGVDCIMTMLFGSLIYNLLKQDKDIWDYISLTLSLSVLVLIKVNAILLVVVLFITVLAGLIRIKNRKQALFSLLPFLSSFIFYFSWKIYCRIAGNTSYLGNRVDSNLKTAAFALPEYAVEVTGKFIKALFTLHLNGGAFGMVPAAFIILSVLLTCFIIKRHGRIQIGILWGGYIAYLFMLLYMYLYIFDEWEAKSLSSLDRYIGVYTVGMFLGLLLLWIRSEEKNIIIPLSALLAASVFTINYDFAFKTLLPGNYQNTYSGIYEKRQAVEKDFAAFYEEHPEYRGGRLLIINKENDDELVKYQQYAAVPSVTRVYTEDELKAAGIEELMAEFSADGLYYAGE